jgi:hypothetical protein
LSGQLANTIGALIINEVIATVRSLPRGVKHRTYLFLDEFQNFVGPDLESALPETRQLGLNLVLSHQSFAQLERGDYDLSAMIFAAQSRMIFGVQGEDADILAHEVASLTFDAKRIKEELYSRRQLLRGIAARRWRAARRRMAAVPRKACRRTRAPQPRGESARPSQREAQETRSDTETSAQGNGEQQRQLAHDDAWLARDAGAGVRRVSGTLEPNVLDVRGTEERVGARNPAAAHGRGDPAAGERSEAVPRERKTLGAGILWTTTCRRWPASCRTCWSRWTG